MKETTHAENGVYESAVFQTATLIYDAVYWFCETFLNSRSMMADQMMRSARSGRQNIAKGLLARETSPQMQRRYINLACTQYDGLLLDCGDYLRHRRLKQWDGNTAEAMEIKEILQGDASGQAGRSGLTDEERWGRYSPWLEHEEPAVRINALICLIRRIHDLLDHLPVCAEAHTASGSGPASGLQRNGVQATGGAAGRSDADASTPLCPQCGNAMVKRMAKTGKAAGQPFWGCSGYPECKAIVKV